jgi:hypothetical protein
MNVSPTNDMNAWGELKIQLGNRWRRWVVSLHAPAALLPGKEPQVPTQYEARGTLNGGFDEKNLLQPGNGTRT